MLPLAQDMSEIYAHPLPRVYAIFLFAIEYSAKAQHTTTGFFDMSSTSGYMGAKYFQEFGPRFLGAYPLAHTPLREVSKERFFCTWPYLKRICANCVDIGDVGFRDIEICIDYVVRPVSS